jgi:hypothetical protein
VTFFRWVSAPENPALGDRIISDVPFWKFSPFTLQSVPSYGIEAEIGVSC